MAGSWISGIGLCLILAGCTPEQTGNDADIWSRGHTHTTDLSFQQGVDLLALDGVQTQWLTGQGTASFTLLLSIDLARFEPNLIAKPNIGISARAAMLETGADIVLGSGFVSEAHSLDPVGLLHVGGSTLSPLEPYGYTRILGFNDSGFGVVHRNAYQRDMFTSAFQAGPGIIEKGLLDISERDLQRPMYYRSFVALCDNGNHQHVQLGITTVPTHLRTLGQRLEQHFAAIGAQCQEVVNLAGDRQAVLAIRAGEGLLYHGDIETHKVTLLSFKRPA